MVFCLKHPNSPTPDLSTNPPTKLNYIFQEASPIHLISILDKNLHHLNLVSPNNPQNPSWFIPKHTLERICCEEWEAIMNCGGRLSRRYY